MPRTRKDWLILTLITAVLGVLWINATRVKPGDDLTLGLQPAPEPGSPAPDFTLQTLDGETITLSDLRGQPVVINFWATWCPPCRAEIPALDAVYRAQGGDVVILGVDVQESPATVAAFAAEYDMSYPVPLDPDAEVARLYRVRAFPTTVFVDADGVVRHVVTGALNEALLYTRLTEIAGR